MQSQPPQEIRDMADKRDDHGKHKGQEKKLPDVSTFDDEPTAPPPDGEGSGGGGTKNPPPPSTGG